MSSFWGMAPQQARDHGQRVMRAAGALERLRDRVDCAVHAVAWTGEDAETFQASWESVAARDLADAQRTLRRYALELYVHAAEQEAASDPTGAMSSQSPRGATDRGTIGPGRDGSGYLDRDNPWIPNWLEAPAEGAMSHLAGLVSDGIGWGADALLGGLVWSAGTLGWDPDGIEQARGDLEHLGGLLKDTATGERMPTISELGASAILAGGSMALAPVELVTDTGLLDPRTDVEVHRIREVQDPSTPQTLADLVYTHDEARREMFGLAAPGGGFDPTAAGQIRIQTVRQADGSAGYIVYAPPTGGEPIWAPDAWGAQGNSAGWDSNLRSMAGQESAAMADVRGALEAAGVPPGAEVMFVGHSQGGLTAAQLAADPLFNNTSGAPGSYTVTHSFSIGSPVETVAPAQAGTQVINVAHNPVWADPPQGLGALSPAPMLTHIADPVPRLDLNGFRLDGSRIGAPNVRDVWLDAPVQTYDSASQIHNAHNSVLRTSSSQVDPTAGYYGSVRQGTATHPALRGLQEDIEGRYIGPGVTVIKDQVVEVGRDDLR